MASRRSMITFSVRPLRSILSLLLRLRLPRAAFLHWLDVERPRLLLKKEAVGAGVAPARMLHAAGNEKIGPRPSPKSSSSASARRFAARNRTRRSAGADAPCGPDLLARVPGERSLCLFGSRLRALRCRLDAGGFRFCPARRALGSRRGLFSSRRSLRGPVLLLRAPSGEGGQDHQTRHARLDRALHRCLPPLGCASSPAGRGPSSGLPPFALVLLHPAASRTRSANDSTPTR